MRKNALEANNFSYLSKLKHYGIFMYFDPRKQDFISVAHFWKNR